VAAPVTREDWNERVAVVEGVVGWERAAVRNHGEGGVVRGKRDTDRRACLGTGNTPDEIPVPARKVRDGPEDTPYTVACAETHPDPLDLDSYLDHPDRAFRTTAGAAGVAVADAAPVSRWRKEPYGGNAVCGGAAAEVGPTVLAKCWEDPDPDPGGLDGGLVGAIAVVGVPRALVVVVAGVGGVVWLGAPCRELDAVVVAVAVVAGGKFLSGDPYGDP